MKKTNQNKTIQAIAVIFLALVVLGGEGIAMHNTAFNRSVSASANYNEALSPEKAIDGDISTFWEHDTYTAAWLSVDLGDNYTIDHIQVYASSGLENHSVSGSTDNSTWSLLYNTSSYTILTWGNFSFAPTKVRWVKIKQEVGQAAYCYLKELRVYKAKEGAKSSRVAWYVPANNSVRRTPSWINLFSDKSYIFFDDSLSESALNENEIDILIASDLKMSDEAVATIKNWTSNGGNYIMIQYPGYRYLNSSVRSFADPTGIFGDFHESSYLTGTPLTLSNTDHQILQDVGDKYVNITGASWALDRVKANGLADIVTPLASWNNTASCAIATTEWARGTVTYLSSYNTFGMNVLEEAFITDYISGPQLAKNIKKWSTNQNNSFDVTVVYPRADHVVLLTFDDLGNHNATYLTPIVSLLSNHTVSATYLVSSKDAIITGDKEPKGSGENAIEFLQDNDWDLSGVHETNSTKEAYFDNDSSTEADCKLLMTDAINDVKDLTGEDDIFAWRFSGGGDSDGANKALFDTDIPIRSNIGYGASGNTWYEAFLPSVWYENSTRTDLFEVSYGVQDDLSYTGSGDYENYSRDHLKRDFNRSVDLEYSNFCCLFHAGGTVATESGISAIDDFITFAKTKDSVRFITFKQMAKYLRVLDNITINTSYVGADTTQVTINSTSNYSMTELTLKIHSNISEVTNEDGTYLILVDGPRITVGTTDAESQNTITIINASTYNTSIPRLSAVSNPTADITQATYNTTQIKINASCTSCTYNLTIQNIPWPYITVTRDGAALPTNKYAYDGSTLIIYGWSSSENQYVVQSGTAITFVPPTPPHNSYIPYNSVYINATINGGNASAFTDWNNSLVGYWSMDYYNSTGVFDNSSNNNFGEFKGAGFGVDNLATGKWGKGLLFDGVDDYVNCGTPFTTLTGFTATSWIQYNSLSGTGVYSSIVQKGVEGWNSILWMYYHEGNSRYSFEWGNGTSRTDLVYSTTPALNQWYFVAVTFDNGDAKIYIDGEEKSTKSSGITFINAAVKDFMIGAYRSDSPSHHFNGTIDEVRIYNRALSAAEISASYNGSAEGYGVNITNQDNGTYAYKVGAIDEAGNLGFSETMIVSLGGVDSCRTIYESTGLIQDIVSDGSCIVVGGNGLTLDCNGYSIIGNKSGIGINITHYNDTTITNCTVTNFSKQIFAYDVANISFKDSKSLDAHFYNATGIHVDLDYTNCRYAFRNAKIQSNPDWDNCNFNITLPQSRVVHVTSYNAFPYSKQKILAWGAFGLSFLLYLRSRRGRMR